MRSSRYCHNYTSSRPFVKITANLKQIAYQRRGLGRNQRNSRSRLKILHSGRRPLPPPPGHNGASGLAAASHLPAPFLVLSMNAATFACRAFKSGSCA